MLYWIVLDVQNGDVWFEDERRVDKAKQRSGKRDEMGAIAKSILTGEG